MNNKKGFSRILALLIIAVAVFIFFYPTINLLYFIKLDKDSIISETNVQRARNGLPPLETNETLNKMAEAKAKDMFEKQYFEHVSPTNYDLEDLADDFDYKYLQVGENLLEGNFASEKELVQRWMDSPDHRHNILNAQFLEIGVAVIKGKYKGKTVWMAVQEFGVRSKY